MNIYEIQKRDPFLIHQLTEVWEDSVRKTHLFLSDTERNGIKAFVPQALKEVPHLIAAERIPQHPVAFMGVGGNRLEMLFLSSAERGAGLDRQLLEYGIRQYGVQEVTVNEQNPQAVGFYKHLGFEPYKRTEHEEEGRPYPLLYMKLV